MIERMIIDVTIGVMIAERTTAVPADWRWSRSASPSESTICSGTLYSTNSPVARSERQNTGSLSMRV
jgi:hypothetical protein